MHLVTLGLDDDEYRALFEMMRVTGCATPAAVVKQALWKQARFLEVDVAADAFASYRTRGERASRRRVRRSKARPGVAAVPPLDPPAPVDSPPVPPPAAGPSRAR